MNNVRFDIRFDPDAAREYQKLDNSIVEIVNKSIDELQYRADDVGKLLSNKHNTKLSGCKEIKLRDAGLRIVFRVTNEMVDILRIVYILAVEQHSKDMAFIVANNRLTRLKDIPDGELREFLKATRKWKIVKK